MVTAKHIVSAASKLIRHRRCLMDTVSDKSCHSMALWLHVRRVVYVPPSCQLTLGWVEVVKAPQAL